MRVGIFYCYIVIGPIDKYDCLILYNQMGTNHKTDIYFFNVSKEKNKISPKSITIRKKKNWVILFPRVRRWQSGSDVRRRENDNIDEIIISWCGKELPHKLFRPGSCPLRQCEITKSLRELTGKGKRFSSYASLFLRGYFILVDMKTYLHTRF